MPRHASPPLRRLLSAPLALLAALSLTACGSKGETHVQILDRDPPPAEWKDASACPDEAPPPVMVNDQTMLGWAMGEIYAKRLCRNTWQQMVNWAFNPPTSKEKK